MSLSGETTSVRREESELTREALDQAEIGIRDRAALALSKLKDAWDAMFKRFARQARKGTSAAHVLARWTDNVLGRTPCPDSGGGGRDVGGYA